MAALVLPPKDRGGRPAPDDGGPTRGERCGRLQTVTTLHRRACQPPARTSPQSARIGRDVPHLRYASDTRGPRPTGRGPRNSDYDSADVDPRTERERHHLRVHLSGGDGAETGDVDRAVGAGGAPRHRVEVVVRERLDEGVRGRQGSADLDP